MHTVLKSAKKDITIGIDKPFVMIGEKINPTGSKKLATALRDGDLDFVRQLAERQVAWGAEVLDINVGLPNFDEITAIAKVVEAVSSAVEVPLCLELCESRGACCRIKSRARQTADQFRQRRRKAPRLRFAIGEGTWRGSHRLDHWRYRHPKDRGRTCRGCGTNPGARREDRHSSRRCNH